MKRIENIMLSDLEIRLVTVEVLQKFNKGVQGLALVVFIQNAVNPLTLVMGI